MFYFDIWVHYNTDKLHSWRLFTISPLQLNATSAYEWNACRRLTIRLLFCSRRKSNCFILPVVPLDEVRIRWDSMRSTSSDGVCVVRTVVAWRRRPSRRFSRCEGVSGARNDLVRFRWLWIRPLRSNDDSLARATAWCRRTLRRYWCWWSRTFSFVMLFKCFGSSREARVLSVLRRAFRCFEV